VQVQEMSEYFYDREFTRNLDADPSGGVRRG
jgi:hypothetical protein